ncbi:hypothetical protein N7520_005779 [Penicillium odoratum]|uniref:uncharacterized protein n=1 Tax=Penicillium odoratum TaxID=1167516 RepID=UPI002546D43D|nr:uncharacterized protein N7520_005779 [Penicillium odoratum]KAJ5758623.1 hypothetical protein N7520_005779 [Penicillium odoratum]
MDYDMESEYGAEDDFNDEEYSDYSDEDAFADGMQLDNPDNHTSMSNRPLENTQQFLLESHNASDFSTRASNPNSYPHRSERRLAHRPDKTSRPRTKLTTEEHAALTVLNDEELLTMYAVKSGQTLPQTRRLFQAKLIANGDANLEEELFAARFAVPASMAHLVPVLNMQNPPVGPGAPERALGFDNTAAYLVPARWKVRIDHDEGGWWAPGQKKRDGGARRGRKSGEGFRG